VDHKSSIIVNKTLTIKIRYGYGSDNGANTYVYGIFQMDCRNLTLYVWRLAGGMHTWMAIHGELHYEVILPTLGEWNITVNYHNLSTLMVEERKIPGFPIGFISLSILLGIALSIYLMRKKTCRTI
jgi:hypothetical protein